jgi:rRNA maturation RNase YbeY
MKNLTVGTSKNIKVDKRLVHSLILKLSKELKFNIEALSINFVSAEYLLEINKQYLKHHYHTDIITFNYSGSNDNLDGELFISIHEAIANSLKYDVSLDNELVRLVIHGVLHLVGYDDKKAAEKKKMKLEEDRLTQNYEKEIKSVLIEYDY